MMYKGDKKFDREQLVFMSELVFSGVRDAIESALPPAIGVDEFKEREVEIKEYICGATNTVAMSLAVMYAQLNDDGLGRGDFRQFEQFEKMVDDYITECVDGNSSGWFPSTRPLSESFVDQYFDEYLK